jgi:hypothetical protein
MTQPNQPAPFVVEAEIEELEPRTASAIGNPGTTDVVSLLGLVYIYTLL